MRTIAQIRAKRSGYSLRHLTLVHTSQTFYGGDIITTNIYHIKEGLFVVGSVQHWNRSDVRWCECHTLKEAVEAISGFIYNAL